MLFFKCEQKNTTYLVPIYRSLYTTGCGPSGNGQMADILLNNAIGVKVGLSLAVKQVLGIVKIYVNHVFCTVQN